MGRVNVQLWLIGKEVFETTTETKIEDVAPPGQWDKWALEYGTEPPIDYYLASAKVAVAHFGSKCGNSDVGYYLPRDGVNWPWDTTGHKAIRGTLRTIPAVDAISGGSVPPWEVKAHFKVYPDGWFAYTSNYGDGGLMWLTIGRAWDGGAIGLYMEAQLVLGVAYYKIQLRKAYGLTFDDLRNPSNGEVIATLYEGQYSSGVFTPIEFDAVFNYSGGWGTVTVNGATVAGAVGYPVLGFYAGSWQFNTGKFRVDIELIELTRG